MIGKEGKDDRKEFTSVGNCSISSEYFAYSDYEQYGSYGDKAKDSVLEPKFTTFWVETCLCKVSEQFRLP